MKTITAAWKLAKAVGEPNIFKNMAKSTVQAGRDLSGTVEQSGSELQSGLKWQGRKANAGNMLRSGIAGTLGGPQKTPGETLSQGLSQGANTHQAVRGAQQNVGQQTTFMRHMVRSNAMQQANQFEAAGKILGNVGQPQANISAGSSNIGVQPVKSPSGISSTPTTNMTM